MARVITGDELTLLRTPGDWSRFRLAIHLPTTIYTARVNGVPASNDMVNQIDYDGDEGTLADIHDDMLMYVGSTAGARDKGMVRLRKAPTSSIFYFGEVSNIVWTDNDYLTVVDAFAIRERPVRVVSGESFMDSDIEFSDQHIDFDPVPMLGPHIVVRMEDADVDVTLGPPADTPSWVFDSTIDSVEWVIPDAVAIDDDTTINPVATFDTVGWHVCYCTVTADNGKSFEGVRYVYVWNTENPPARAFSITQDPTCDYDDGGYEFGVDLYDEASLGLVREGALCILFAQDYYDGEEQSIGPLEGRENIVVMGWIAGESIEWDPETGGRVQFTVQGPHYWMKNNSKYGLELLFATNTPDAWNVMPSLSVARALWHLLHWRFNVTKLMDVLMTDDARMTLQIKTPSDSLWDQMNEIAFKRIFARPGCDRLGRLIIEIDPQMVPEADRDWPVVQTLTKKDWQGLIEIERRTLSELCMLFTSGEMADGGSSNTLYSLAPGHMPLQYGEPDIVEGLLVSDQEQANEQAGLYMGWRNNEFPEMQIVIPQNNRMIDLYPRQFLDITFAEEDTVRGIAYSGNIIPRFITLRVDSEAGTLSCELRCEAETFAYPAINGDIPATAGGNDFDFSIPPLPELPALPDLGMIVYPSPIDVNENHPKEVIIASSLGIFYTVDFDEDNPTWLAMNNGLTSLEKVEFAQLVKTPGGVLYGLTDGDDATGWGKVVRASGLGGIWETVFLSTEYSGTARITGLGVNPNQTDEVAIVVGDSFATVGDLDTAKIYVGSGGSFSAGDFVRLKFDKYLKAVVFWNDSWVVFGHRPFGIGGSLAQLNFWTYDSDGSLTSDEDGINWGVGAGGTVGDTGASVGADRILAWGGNSDGYAILTGLEDGEFTNVTDQIELRSVQGAALSPTGIKGMGYDNSGGVPAYQTTDNGATWQSMSGTIPNGSDVWENCGDDNRWLFGGGTVIRLTVDQGLTYSNKNGNLGYIAPLIDIHLIRFIS